MKLVESPLSDRNLLFALRVYEITGVFKPHPCRKSRIALPKLAMALHSFFSKLLLPLGLAAIALPAIAGPEIASGDRLLTINSTDCLARADSLIAELGIESDTGEIDRTGYFEDGTFRILCYGSGQQSMAVVFAAHDNSLDIATSFVRMALDRLSQGSTTAQPATAPTEDD